MIYPMLLSVCKEKDLSIYEDKYIAQEKFDGTRIIVIKNGENIKFQTRSGKSDLAKDYPEIVEVLSRVHPDFIIDGELIFYDKNGKQKFLTGKAKESRDGLTAKLILFDVLEIDHISCRQKSLIKRGAWIANFVAFVLMCPSVVDAAPWCFTEFNKFFEAVILKGGEGIVLKKADSIYQDGKRSKDWLKVKRVETTDCFILGLMKGEGKYADTFGSLILGQYDRDGKLIVVCNCSGFTDAERKMFYTIIMASPYKEMFPSTKGELGHILHKCAPNMVVEIEFMERLESGSVRHPRFVRVRDDKLPKDCIYEGE